MSPASGREPFAAAAARARQAWPELAVPGEAFEQRLRECVEAQPEAPEAPQALESLHVDDLYWAFACSLGDARALAAFENECAAGLRGFLEGAGITAAIIGDTLQQMREELFVSRPGRAPGILTYSGKGPLAAWLRVIAIRTARRASGRAAAAAAGHSESDDLVAPHDLELAYLKKTYGKPFEHAFRVALAALSAEDRVLLKQRFRHGMTVEQLGTMHGVHASTVSRRVTDARERLVAGVRDEMMRALQVGRAEVSSILRLISSEVDITLSSVAELDRTGA